MNPFTTNLARLDTVRAARDNELELRALAARFSKSSDEQVEPLCRMEPSEVHDERMARRYPALSAQIWVRADLWRSDPIGKRHDRRRESESADSRMLGRRCGVKKNRPPQTQLVKSVVSEQARH